MKQKHTLARALLAASLTLTAAASICLCISQSSTEVNAAQSTYNPSKTYTTGDAATYYSGISDVETGTTLLGSLRTLNSSRKKTTVGYSNMNNNDSGSVSNSVTGSAFKYTEYDPSSATTDSNGQPYGLTIYSFYSGNKITNTSGTAWNREHVWPNSHGGNVVEGDIFMPKPTIKTENSSRSNYFYNETTKPSSEDGWDPASMGDATYRGDSARDIFYCVVANSQLSLLDASYHATSNDNNDYMMGKLSKLLEWNLKYPVLDRENRRNEGGEYLQGNRNPFVDHPEYACKIWGDTNSTTQSVCAAGAQYATLSSISLSQNTITGLANGSTVQLSATATYSDESTADFTSKVTWASSNTAVATVSTSGLVTSHSTSASDYANITATYSDKSATCQFYGTDPVATELTGVSASAVSVNIGATQTIVPSPLPANAYPVPTYSYASNNPSIASVTSAGVVTGVAAGSTTITVTATQDSIVKTADITVTVSEAPVVTSATIVYTDFAGYDSSEKEHVTADGSIKLKAMNVGTYDKSTIQFKKSSGYFYNSESLNLKSITINGLTGALTVYGSSTANGKTKTITGTNNVYDLSGYNYFTIENGSSTSNCTSVVLEFANSGSGSTDSVSLDQSSLAMTVGGSDVTLTATASGTVTWSTNASGVATVSNGTVHAVGAGNATITATCGTATATCNVTVSDSETPSTDGITFALTKSNSGLTTTASTSSQVVAYTLSDNTHKLPMVLSDGINNTSSYDEISVAKGKSISSFGGMYVKSVTVDYYRYQNFVVTANGVSVTGVVGTSTSNTSSLVYTYTINSDVWAFTASSSYAATFYSMAFECDPSIAAVGLDQSEASMVVGGSDLSLVAYGNATLTWGSDATGIATVSDGTVHAVAAGVANISVSSGNVSKTCVVTVSEPTIDSVSLNTSSLSLKVGQTNTLVATASGTVTWASDNAAATVSSSGLVTAVSVGSATITATVGTATANCVVTITAADTPVVTDGTWTLVSDASTLAVGDVLVLATSTGFTAGDFVTSKAYLSSIASTFAADASTITSLGADSISFTLGGEIDAWTLSYSSKLLGATANKSTAWDSGTTTWSIAIDDSGNATIQSTTSAYGRFLYNVSTACFRNYTSDSSTAMLLPQLYRLEGGTTTYTADNFATDFLGNITCDATGTIAPTFNKTWSELASLYASISSETEKALLINATYTVSGVGASTVVTATGTTTSNIANAMYRYDYIITKYGSGTYTNFISGRTPSALNVSPISQNTDSSNYLPLIAIISLVGVTAIAGYMFIRRRKEK